MELPDLHQVLLNDIIDVLVDFDIVNIHYLYGELRINIQHATSRFSTEIKITSNKITIFPYKKDNRTIFGIEFRITQYSKDDLENAIRELLIVLQSDAISCGARYV